MEDILKQNLIKNLGIGVLAKKEQEEVLLRIGKIIFQSVLIRVMERLNSKEKDQFMRLLTEKPDDEKGILDFLKSKIPDFNEIVNEEVASFKKESLDFMKQIKK